jgi:hypothetical protein
VSFLTLAAPMQAACSAVRPRLIQSPVGEGGCGQHRPHLAPFSTARAPLKTALPSETGAVLTVRFYAEDGSQERLTARVPSLMC